MYEDPCDEWLDLISNKLTSPNFPEPYDRLTECKWNLTAPQGHYITLDFEIIDVNNRGVLFLPSIMVPFLNFFIFNSFILGLIMITY